MSSKEDLSNQIIKKDDNSLLNIKRFLKKYDLLNNKNLIKRKETYYFSFYLQKDKNIQYSLNTNDFLLSNILKYKILIKMKEEFKKMGFEEYNKQFDTKLTILKTKNGFMVEKDEEEENNLIENITQKTIRTIKKSKVQISKESNIDIKYTRKSKNNIKKHIDLYVNYLTTINNNKKTVKSYIEKFNVLVDYFNHKKILSLKDINKKDCKDLQLYLLNFPKNLNKYLELTNKNIFEMIDKKDKLLDKYEKLEKSTVDNYITRYKTLFNYFRENDYIYSNYFLDIKKMTNNKNNSFKNFIDKEDTYNILEVEEFEKLVKNIQDTETRKLIIFALSCGLRISEIFNLKKINLLKIKDNYIIDVKKSKTKNGIRKVPINNFFTFFIDDILKDKEENEYLFFNEEQKENRNDNLEKKVMRKFRKIIKDKNKVFHSIRKNFTQLLYINDVDELYIKLILGHSLKDNLSFNVYNLSKVNEKTKIEIINKIDFSEYFENINFYEIEKIKQKEQNEKIKEEINYNNLSL